MLYDYFEKDREKTANKGDQYLDMKLIILLQSTKVERLQGE